MRIIAFQRTVRLHLAIGACMAISAGCASNHPSQEVWTTKNEPSALGLRSDLPPPNLGDPLPVVDPANLRQSAATMLLQATESTNALLRANAIEALHASPEAIEAVVQRGLGDQNRAVRFVSAMSVGKLKLNSIANLLAPLLHDESPSVQAAAIYGLRRCGLKADLNPLAAMLRAEDPEVKGNAALVLGELGDPSAIPMLRDAIGRGLHRTAPIRRKIVELQLAESMAKLGAHNQIDVIRAALFAAPEEGELAALACQMCGSIRDGGALPDLHNIVRRTGAFARAPEVRIAAASAIAQIDRSRALIDVPLEYASSSRYELRSQAGHSLGIIGTAARANGQGVDEVLSALASLLEDSNPLVQISAAGAILRLHAGNASF